MLSYLLTTRRLSVKVLFLSLPVSSNLDEIHYLEQYSDVTVYSHVRPTHIEAAK